MRVLLDFFCQFQPGVAYKSAAYKKSVYGAFSKRAFNCFRKEPHLRHLFDRLQNLLLIEKFI